MKKPFCQCIDLTETGKFPVETQQAKETDNMTNLVFIKEIKCILKNLPTKQIDK